MRYATAPAFRRALEDRLNRRAAGDGSRIARDRKRVVFDRFLARLVEVAAEAWVLKGGFALDLRLDDRARSTKDIDLAWLDADDELLDILIDAASDDQGDFFAFTVERTDDPPERFGGAHRLRIAASLAGRQFDTFVLDAGPTDAATSTDVVRTHDLLSFAGIAPVAVPTIPITVQAAEKLHAYTRVYEGGRVSSRVKDLVDLELITQLCPLDADDLRRTTEAIFAIRATHQRPRAVPVPPEPWRAPFRRLATAVGLDGDLDAGHRAVAAMLDPVLDDRVQCGRWDPDAQHWTDVAAS